MTTPRPDFRRPPPGRFGGIGGLFGGMGGRMGGYNPFMGGGFNPYQQQRNPFMGGGMGGFNPYQQQQDPQAPPSISDLYGGLDEEQKNAFLQQYGLGALPTTPDEAPISAV